jgi:glycosyltransferase involved in cell wall biosynthesis
MKPPLVIIIPCFNEAERITVSKFVSFLQEQPSVMIVFANDGSTDKTAEILNEIRNIDPGRVFIHNLEKNKGKAEAIREGVMFCISKNLRPERIAYLDADGSTSLEECCSISQNVNNIIVFAFGSRILKIDNNITRKFYRHLVGRVLATLISAQLRIHVYDTQCGCKVFDAELAEKLFQEQFISKWLFDVEIFHRLIRIYGTEKMQNICMEIPLKNWIDTADSRVRFSYFFRIWIDLLMIKRRYR